MNKTSTLEFNCLPIDNAELLRFAEDNASEEPRDYVIDALLRFSRSLEVRNSDITGKTEFIYN
ncbi:MAG: hypothetical protein MUC87_06050 [Bacteroidia bacterium]|jgi:hypothetical protein|nr:hypothetical protein [Bacteroidia bacterium]